MFIVVDIEVPSKNTGGTLWLDDSDSEEFRFRSKWGSVRLRKRTAYPVTFAQQNDGVLALGYGNPPGLNDLTGKSGRWQNNAEEFLLLLLNASDGKVICYRDAHCTLPIFMYADSTRLRLSDDMSEVVRGVKPTVHRQALASLLLAPIIDEKTLFTGIELLTDRTQLEWHKGVVTSNKPNLPSFSANSSDPNEFKKLLETTLDASWQNAGNSKVAFEVSGGIDSATMPLHVARKYSPRMLMGSMDFIENFGATQATKLQNIQSATGATILRSHISKEQHYPLARFFQDGFDPGIFYQYQEIYSEALTELARKFQAEGVEVIFTGIGGDELFENIATGSTPKDISKVEYLNDKQFKQMKKQLIQGKSKQSLLADSALFAGQSRNKIYIDHGIWPIAPLTNPLLHNFTQYLPVIYKANKNVLRAYHEAKNFPEPVYKPMQNEHFGRFFEDALKENYQRVLTMLGKKSQLQQLDIVDWQLVMQAFDDARWHENRSRELFDIFRLATAEVILQGL